MSDYEQRRIFINHLDFALPRPSIQQSLIEAYFMWGTVLACENTAVNLTYKLLRGAYILVSRDKQIYKHDDLQWELL